MLSSCAAVRMLSQSGDIPRSTKVVLSRAAHTLQHWASMAPETEFIVSKSKAPSGTQQMQGLNRLSASVYKSAFGYLSAAMAKPTTRGSRMARIQIAVERKGLGASARRLRPAAVAINPIMALQHCIAAHRTNGWNPPG